MTHRQLIVGNALALRDARLLAFKTLYFRTHVYSEAYILQETYLNITVTLKQMEVYVCVKQLYVLSDFVKDQHVLCTVGVVILILSHY